jgi:DNA ligase-1
MSKLVLPLLAGKIKDLSKVALPAYASPKVDGFRMSVQGGKALSRSLKPIRNEFTRVLYSRVFLEGLDGELVAGSPTASDSFNQTSSLCTARSGEPSTCFYVFDEMSDLKAGFDVRRGRAARAVEYANNRHPSFPVKLLPQVPVYTHSQLLKLWEKWKKEGYEGVMLRSFAGHYKQGATPSACRSTVREAILLKYKEMESDEAVIIGTYEQMENTNAKVLQANGTSKRTSHKSGKVGKGTLGGLVVVSLKLWLSYTGSDRLAFIKKLYDDKQVFHIGTGPGFTNDTRSSMWVKRKSLVGKIVTYKYQAVGTKNAPRIPLLVGFRPSGDIS